MTTTTVCSLLSFQRIECDDEEEEKKLSTKTASFCIWCSELRTDYCCVAAPEARKNIITYSLSPVFIAFGRVCVCARAL